MFHYSVSQSMLSCNYGVHGLLRHKDLKSKLPRKKIKEGQTDPGKTSADHWMIAIVDDEEL